MAKRLRGEEHVAVIGQGVCASHRWLPHAQQVALHLLPRIELLWLGLREENSQGAGRMVASLELEHFHTLTHFTVSIFVGHNVNKKAVVTSIHSMLELTGTELSHITETRRCYVKISFFFFFKVRDM